MAIYTNQELLNYVSRIKLTQDKKSSYGDQIDALKNNVIKAVDEMQDAKVIKVRRAGSWRKGTALAPTGDYPLDVDMVFYMRVDKETAFDAGELRDEIIKVLRKSYPNKESSDFTNGLKTIGIVFRGSGLEVDIVPFIPEDNSSGYGRQPQKILNSGDFRTSVDGQLQFISDIKSGFSGFTSIVRIMKSWRNFKELELSSFSIELIVASLYEEGRISDEVSINESVLNFLEFLGRNEEVRIWFPKAPGQEPSAAPWISDPTNNENNVLSNVSDTDWSSITSEAEKGFEILSFAQEVQEKGRTLGLWKDVFGPRFSVEEDS